MSAEFINKEGQPVIYPIMLDENEISIVKGKKVIIGNIGRILKGESNSQLLLFQMDKYYDNIDISQKSIEIVYRDSMNNIYRDSAVNISYNDNFVRFNWLISSKVTQHAGKVTASIHFIGEDEKGKPYVLKTEDFQIFVQDSIDGEELVINAPESWFVEVERRITALESISSETTNGIAMFTGTMEQFRDAVNDGIITEGMIVNIIEEDISPIQI